MAVANNVVPYTLYPIAQHYVDTGVAAILAATAPLFALAIGHFAVPVRQPARPRSSLCTLTLTMTSCGGLQGSERMTLLRALAVVVGLGGVVVLSLQKIGSKDHFR
jgi:drug/metabolite transporter (DMT)-like permease